MPKVNTGGIASSSGLTSSPAPMFSAGGDITGSLTSQIVARITGVGGLIPILAQEILFSGGVDGNGDVLPATDALRTGFRTTNATANQVLSSITPTDGQEIRVISEVMAVRTDVVGQAAWFLLRGIWLRVGASLTVVKAPEVLATGATTGATTWTAVLAAVGTAVQTQVTGEAAKTVHWSLVREWIEAS